MMNGWIDIIRDILLYIYIGEGGREGIEGERGEKREEREERREREERIEDGKRQWEGEGRKMSEKGCLREGEGEGHQGRGKGSESAGGKG